MVFYCLSICNVLFFFFLTRHCFTKCILKTLRATVVFGQCITDNVCSSKVVRLLRHTPCALYLHGHISNFLYTKYFKTDVMFSCGNV